MFIDTVRKKFGLRAFGTSDYGVGRFGKNRDDDGLTFAKFFSNETLDAEFSDGSPTATFTATRSASAPATYIDSDGVIQVVTDSDVPRFTSGYYDATGYHAWANGKKGVMIEGASTNLLTYSSDLTNEAWTPSGFVATAKTQNAPDGSTNGTLVNNMIAGTDYVSYGYTFENISYTFSVWLKAPTTNGTVSLNYYDGSHHRTDVSVVTTEWRRFTLSFTPLAGGGFVYPIDTRGTGTLNEVIVWGAQLEALPFASSYIPTTTTALTRGAEVLKYAISGNRTAATEGCVVKVAPSYKDGVLSTDGYISSTDTKNRLFRFKAGSNDVVIKGNGTDETGTLVEDLVNESWVANTEMTLAYNVQASGNPNIAGFYNGVADGTNTNTDFTSPAWGTYFYLGANTDANYLYGTIFSVAFWNRVLTAEEQLNVYNILE